MSAVAKSTRPAERPDKALPRLGLADIGTKLLCIDEVHHLLAGSQREQRRALNLLKFVANELKIAVVAVGTHDAFHAMQIDSQVASRFEPLLLPRWTEIDGFRGFVTGYGRLLWTGIEKRVIPGIRAV